MLIEFATTLSTFSEERGATGVEYSLLVALIFVVFAGTVSILSGQVKSLFDAIAVWN
jgi:Flp pilus assembly pilin Flp